MKLSAVILTHNEEQHLARCIESVKGVADEVVVADCYSKDGTIGIAKSLGARVVQNEWVNYATQFNWALTQLNPDSEWVLRIDADEYLTTGLAAEIREKLPTVEPQVDGVYCGRSMVFQGRRIKHGGLFPIRVLRLFRFDRGRCENRWMDEHIKVQGPTVDFEGELVDENLNSLTWWTEKHNGYASREAVDLLNLEYRFMDHESVAGLAGAKQPGVKRWLKEKVYARFPRGVRALGYFTYRYFFRLGFLDGREGATFHFLQGFWYRYLVDAKVSEVKRYVRSKDTGITEAIEAVLGVTINSKGHNG